METPWSARLLRADDARGSGVLVTPSLLLTCAHVLTAQPRAEEPPDVSASQPWVAHFATVGPDATYRVAGLADDAAWMPGGADLVLLRVEPEAGVEPVPPAVCRWQRMVEPRLIAVGWPGTSPKQVSLEIRLLGFSSPKSVQADLVVPTGYAIARGMSGGAVASSTTGDVVGLLAMRETKDGVRSGQVVPLHAVRHPLLDTVVRRASRAVEERVTDLAATNTRARHFVGRDALFASVAARLGDDSLRAGYLFLRGEPGAGKTAFMAELAARHGWIHHFNRVTAGVTTARQFLGNVCAQLVVAHGLLHEDLPDGFDTSSEVLVRLIAESLDVRRRESRGPLVIVVDGLDESDDPPAGQNRLMLPQTLPDGAYVVCSIRENVDDHVFSTQRWATDLVLREDDANTGDLDTYARWFVREHAERMSRRLDELSVSEDELLAAVLERSEGNFMYLVQVLPDVAAGRLGSGDGIADLPVGLREYYRRHWRDMESRDRRLFRRVQRPVIAMLATAREPVSVSKVVEWVNGSGRFGELHEDDVADVFEDWAQFLHETEDLPPLYRLYHTSFLDFLEQEVGLRPFREASIEAVDAKIDW